MWKVIVGLLVLATVSSCAPSTEVTEGGEAVSLVLPAGNPIDGRRAFQTVGCTLCHTATGEEHLPTPSALKVAPELGRTQAEMSRSDLMRKILNPTHRPSVDDGSEARDQSAMVDYSETLTIRQLVDIAAYLRYVGE